MPEAASPSTAHIFDARGVARRFRHSAIFGALGALQPGEAMRFVNDHDPLPLLDQLRQRFGEHIAIEYQQREPCAACPVSAGARSVQARRSKRAWKNLR